MSSPRPEPGQRLRHRIVEPQHTRGDLRLDCDVVVVGSGAGGATIAATLAEAGLEVVVLEEGAYYDTADYSANISDMLSKLMRGGGSTVMMGRAPVPYLEGKCVGGTTVVNGGMCWRTPEHILDEWVSERGLEDLSAKKLESHFDVVEEVIDARYQDPGSEGGVSGAFKRGADALGWTLNQNKRNQKHCVGSNDCVTGCPSGAKRSTLMTWLPRFFDQGGTLYTCMKVEKIRTENGRATGAKGRITGPRKRSFEVRARAVVLSCGAIQTPLLLQRNKLGKHCGHVGDHFTIHPNIKMAARFDEPVDSLRGTHQAWQCTHFSDEGILLAPGAIPLAFMSAVFPGFGRPLADRLRRDWPYIATGGVLVDDHAEGKIRTLPLGIPFIRYDVTDTDQAKFVRAAALMAELYFAAGANEVYTPFHHLPLIDSPDAIKKLYEHPPKVEDTEYFTAHIMGTCRMDSRPRGGVVDPNGEMWDVPGCYIADASTMPGTIGVNPQVTIMALARHIGVRLAARITRQRKLAA